MSDIARLADVDVSTVSRALADSPRVTEETKERIRKIVEETGYVVHHSGRMLRSQMAGQILVILPNIAAAFFPEIVLGIETAVQKDGISVIIGSSQQDLARENALAQQLLNGAADGIILLTGRLPQILRGVPNVERRIVAISRSIEDADIPLVNISNEDAMAASVRHLLACGHSKIAHLAGPPLSATSATRIRSYEQTMAEAGLHGEVRIETGGGFDIEAGKAAMARLLANGPAPQAVACASDEIAMGAIWYAREKGFKVPEDIAFVGFDDIPVAAVYEPALTTIAAPHRKMGELGAQMLLEQLKTPGPGSKSLVVDHKLVVRKSCGS